MTLNSSSAPISAPRWYGYFSAVTSEYGHSSPTGRVISKAELAWFGIPNSRVLVLKYKETVLPDLGDEKNRKLCEWVVVVDEEAALPITYSAVGGLDADGQPYPAYGVFIKMTYNFALNGTVSRDYLPRVSQYAAQDLLSQPDTQNAPIGLMVSGVREVISALDSATWQGPGSLIVYDRESSFGWLSRSDAPDFEQSRDIRWGPGKAGVYERFLLGTGTLDGWALYAIQDVLVLEFWRSGIQVMSRILHAQELGKLLADPDPTYVLGFGYDLEAGKISIGVAGKSSDGEQSALAFQEYAVPELVNLQHEHRYVYIGGAPVLYQDGQQADRTCWGKIQSVQGQFTAEGYLTRGSLAQLMQEV